VGVAVLDGSRAADIEATSMMAVEVLLDMVRLYERTGLVAMG
jgi:hypothetical protein